MCCCTSNGLTLYCCCAFGLQEDCCSKKYLDADADGECDIDHWCTYLDAEYYAEVQTGGMIVFFLMTGIAVVIVVTRDILKLWNHAPKIYPSPDRQLTTMSAAFAPENFPENFPDQQPVQEVTVTQNAEQAA